MSLSHLQVRVLWGEMLQSASGPYQLSLHESYNLQLAVPGGLESPKASASFVNMYIYIYMYIELYMYIYTHTHTHTHIYIYIYYNM